jgi:agmatine/peptidylarginine deiminase
MRLLAPYGRALQEAQREFFACSNITVIEAPVDDICMGDVAPTFALRERGTRREVVGDRLAKAAASIFIAEGGALATDGRGTLITTRSFRFVSGMGLTKLARNRHGRANGKREINVRLFESSRTRHGARSKRR